MTDYQHTNINVKHQARKTDLITGPIRSLSLAAVDPEPIPGALGKRQEYAQHADTYSHLGAIWHNQYTYWNGFARKPRQMWEEHL